MTLATLANLQTRFGDQVLLLLADRDNDGVIDAGVVEAQLQDADAEIVSLISGAVVIDMANPPLNLVRIACEIAIYKLYGANPPEDTRKRYDDCVKFLGLVARKERTLDGGALAPTAPSIAAVAAATESTPRRFSRDLS
jgi:phage gp36-like protein